MKRKIIGLMLAAVLVFALAACGGSSDSEKATQDSSSKAFVSFEAMDLDGNNVDSGMFGENAVTVVNFWFSECEACLEELGELNKLNEELKEKGGAVIGVNTDTFDGNEKAVERAKEILKEKGAEYTNIWVKSDSDLANFSMGLVAFPTTYVIDSNGNMVGEAILGGINNPSVMKLVQQQIDTAIALKDMA